jgi:hypothetical protein
MDKISALEKDFLKNIKVGWFLAKRDIQTCKYVDNYIDYGGHDPNIS